jgi:hypothetical protein
MIQNSYKVSGKDSLKLLLMTATPVTDDQMSSVKILNLLLEKNENFPEDFEKFKTMYCNENGLFTDEGSREFMNRVSGLISYIDRTNDRSQFAYPVINDILIDVKRMNNNDYGLTELNKNIDENENKLNDQNLNKDEIKEIKNNIKKLKKEKKYADKLNDEPRDIIGFINNCFVKKQIIKKAGVNKKTKPET